MRLVYDNIVYCTLYMDALLGSLVLNSFYLVKEV
jgi:hypothetical protein